MSEVVKHFVQGVDVCGRSKKGGMGGMAWDKGGEQVGGGGGGGGAEMAWAGERGVKSENEV